MIASASGPAGADATRTDPTVAGLTAEIGRLRGELTRRHLLDLATGILAAQLGASPAEAGQHLESLVRVTGLSPEDLAADIVNGVAGTPDAAPPVDGGSQGPVDARRARRVATAAEAQSTVDEAAVTLLEGGLTPLGVQGLWLWQLADNGCLRLAGRAGVSAAEAAVWQWIPPVGPTLLHAVVADAMPRWLPSGPGPDQVLPGPGPRAARALLPLRVKGAPVGVALAVWPGPAELDEAVRRSLSGLVEVAGTVLDADASEPPAAPALVDVLDALAQPAMVLRGDPAATALTVEHVNEAALGALGTSPPAGQPLTLALPFAHAELARLARRAHAAHRVQDAARLPRVREAGAPAPLLDVRILPAGPERTVVLWHVSSDRGLSAARAMGHLQGVATFQDSLSGGGTVWSASAYRIFGIDPQSPPLPLLALRPWVHPDDGQALTELLESLTERQTGGVSVLRIVRDDGTTRHVRVAAEPLVDRGVVTGVTGVFQDVSENRRTEAALTATFDQLTAVQKQAAVRHQLALRLQQAIVPETPDLRRLPGLLAAARYRPAVQEYRVGGDWYDVLPVPGDRVLMAVGDIAGHGIESATGMVALRNALRGLAVTGSAPGRLMEWLNEVTLHTSGHPTATAVCALYDPRDRSLTWSSAGHLPLLLLREGRARLLETPGDVLLGAVPSVTYREVRTPLRPGDTLLLYTDGLIERRQDGLDEGLSHLVEVAEKLSGCAMREQVEGLLTGAAGDTDDDTSVVAIRVQD
ncbi:SpoIIE family protein phosphatase [Streptomyces purpureus]|uniref:SpoIIE family protein phosphatase n=1 Tax=Streptomyces purpureus TaxID=1951 RepID=UPI0037AF3E75